MAENWERQRLLAELEDELDSVLDHMWRLPRRRWQFALGRLRIRLPVNSQIIAQLLALYNLVALTGGVLLILLGEGAATELGIAVVVGALFSLGAFGSAVWVLTVEGEREAFHRSFGADIHEQLKELRLRRDALIDEIETLRVEDDEA